MTPSYWVLATVAWIGGLASISIVVIPAARQALDLQTYASFLIRLQRRLDPSAGPACSFW